MVDDPWINAQQHEKEYFDSGKNKQWRTPHSLEYWLNFLHITYLDGKGLEVGCGPNGLYRFSEHVVGLDPINYHNKRLVNGVAESLPFKDKSFDFVICCNSLDHCQNPKKVVKEMLRVSDRIIVWSNTFPHLIRQMLRYDKTHPYHFDIHSLTRLFPDIYCSILITKSIYSWHGRNATLGGKLKLFLASLLGIEGVCMHLEVKR